MPRRTLTLVGDLIRNVEELGDDDLDEFLSMLEIGLSIAVAESQRRAQMKVERPVLRLIESEAEEEN